MWNEITVIRIPVIFQVNTDDNNREYDQPRASENIVIKSKGKVLVTHIY